MWQTDNDLKEEYKEILNDYRKEDKIYYLYIQIFFSLILVVTSFMLKNGNTTTFYYAKNNYIDIFEKHEYIENSFSYTAYLEKIQNEITSKFSKFTEVFNQINNR